MQWSHVKPSEESKSDWANFIEELSEYASSISDDIITNTKTVNQGTHTMRPSSWSTSSTKLGKTRFPTSAKRPLRTAFPT